MTDERTIAKFLRGLTIGALLGAVIAGSRIWARWSAREQRREGARRREA